jgi:1-acyl-sn-glycerol-3-phosphate acyltransferase
VTDQGRRLSPERPTILAVTHPNSVLDPLLMAVIEPHPLTFSVRDGLFAVPLFGRLLRGIGAIPIARPEDRTHEHSQRAPNPAPKRARWSRRGLRAALAELALGHGKRAGRKSRKNNDAAFAAAREVLHDNGTLTIFPEGETHTNTQVNRLRTGAARLALDAEHHSGWTLGLTLIPVALNYLERETFQSDIHVAYGPPVALADLGPLYRDAPHLAVRELTDRLTTALRGIALDLGPDEQLIIELANALPPPQPNSPSARTARLKQAAAFWSQLQSAAPSAATDLRDRVEALIDTRTRHPLLSALTTRPSSASPSPPTALERAILYATTPLALYGLATSGPTWLITHTLASRLSPRRDRRAPTLLALGAPLLCTTWALQSTAAVTLGPHLTPVALAHALLAPPCALLAARWTTALRHDLSIALTRLLATTRHPLIEERRRIRTALADGPAIDRNGSRPDPGS